MNIYDYIIAIPHFCVVYYEYYLHDIKHCDLRMYYMENDIDGNDKNSLIL